jgi:hypothetical protein
MADQPTGKGRESPDWTQKSLEQLRNLRIFLAIKKVDKEIRDLNESEAVLRNGPKNSVEMANIRLKVNSDLEAMRQSLDEKTYDSVETYVQYALALKEAEVTDENVVQPALEFHRSHPAKVKYTDIELTQKVQRAAEEAEKRQKVLDDEVLRKRIIEEHTLEKELEVINKWRAAGLVFGGRDLEEMGFLTWLAQRSRSSPASPTH